MDDKHADKRHSVYKLALYFLMEVARHLQNTQNRKLVIFLQYIRKIVATALCSIVMQYIQIFYGRPVMLVVTFCNWLFTVVVVLVFSYRGSLLIVVSSLPLLITLHC